MTAARRFVINERLAGFSCVRCDTTLAIGDYPEGCPSCSARNTPASVRSLYKELPNLRSNPRAHGMQRYADWLSYSSWISLGEGGTSCVQAPALAHELGIRALYLKNEGQNPSGSHKDRMSCLTVARALDIGAHKIVAASSGNGGASIALYAAAAGIACRIVSTPALPSLYRQAIAATGAEVVLTSETLERWRVVAEMTRDGWFPATNYLCPPVGSNPFGVDGLRTIAFELVENIGPEAIDVVVAPTSRGDLLWGLYAGFQQLRSAGLIDVVPRLYAVEPFPRLSRVVAGEDIAGSFEGATALSSIGGSTATFQALRAIQASGGGAIPIEDERVENDHRRLAKSGCYAELSSAAALTGLEALLADGRVTRSDRVALIVTAHGYKNPVGGLAS